MKKIFVILFCIFSFFCVNCKVMAESVSLSTNDYELVCEYKDGAIVTITKFGIYVDSTNVASGTSSTIGALNQKATSFYLNSSQQNSIDSEGNIVESKIHNILDNKLFCPTKLYVSRVPMAWDKNLDLEMDDSTEDLDSYTYYYHTEESDIRDKVLNDKYYQAKRNRDEATGGIDRQVAEKKLSAYKQEMTYLASETANLISTKEAKICDYETKTSKDNVSVSTISIYLYDNIQFLYNGNTVTPLSKKISDCPSTGDLYLNDPSKKTIGDETSGKYRYDNIRFDYDKTASGCKSKNAGQDCQGYVYLGTRHGDGNISPSSELCVFIGSNVTNILKEVIAWGQVLVPAIVIILIGLDITKMVLAGNLDEELPKKKKSIIIRLVIMLVFFFAPLVATLIINLLQSAGISVGDIECIFPR